MSDEPVAWASALLERPPQASVTAVAGAATRVGPDGCAPRPWRSMATIGLIIVLAVQAVLSLRLVWTNTAFLDEATYLYAGHVELAHLLSGAPVPAYSTYLSGAPVIYPPLAALADNLGGLAAARILSLGFMLGATSFLWALTTRLAGRLAAFFAVALFATVGATQYLGAFATFDAMSLFLLAAAAWAVVAAGQRDEPAPTCSARRPCWCSRTPQVRHRAVRPGPGRGTLLTTIAERRGLKAAFSSSGYFTVAVTSTIGLLLAIAGPRYVTGVMSTTLARTVGENPPRWS